MSRPRPSGRLRPDLVFLDVESSGLGPGSFPIEIAVCDDALDATAWLVRPDRSWTEWSPIAERLHGITRPILGAEGKDPALVAGLLTAAVGEGIAASDAPSHDAAWLDALFAAAGRNRPFRVVDACEALLGEGTPEAEAIVRARVWDLARQAAGALYPHRHRAEPDARGLAAAWRAAADPDFLLALLAAGR